MFGFLKKKKPKTLLDSLTSAIYGDSPPAKSADVAEAARLASDDLLMGLIDSTEVRHLADELASGPMPYSTHDLALSVALNFLKRPECMELLNVAQLSTRIKMGEWMKEGLVAPIFVMCYEEVLYKLYKPKT